MHETLEGYFGAAQNGAHAPSDKAQSAAHNTVMGLWSGQNDGVQYGRGSFNEYVVGKLGKCALFNVYSGEIQPRKLEK
jgi:hypothetical protein